MRNRMNVFESLESEVRSYCRGWPTVFQKASGSHVYDENGRGLTQHAFAAPACRVGLGFGIVKCG